MAEFLRRHQDLLVSRLRYWHGDIERDDIHRLLRNFRFVAETYGLVIPVAATRRALVDMAMLLAFWAAAAAFGRPGPLSTAFPCPIRQGLSWIPS